MKAGEKFLELTPELYSYMVEHGTRSDPLLQAIESETQQLGPIAVMQIAPEQGAFLELLVRAIGAGHAVEVGTFTGYSAICIARGLSDGGRLVCCELNEDYARTAEENFERAGLSDRIEMKVGPALDSLRALPPDPAIDFSFVDADKPGYAAYYEELLPRTRPGGLILFDNVLMSGRVVDPEPDDESGKALHALNETLARDERVDISMVAISDGITLARKR